MTKKELRTISEEHNRWANTTNDQARANSHRQCALLAEIGLATRSLADSLEDIATRYKQLPM